MEKALEIASNVSTPLALAGLMSSLMFFILKQILSSGLLSKSSSKQSAGLLKLIIDRFFVLSLVAMVLGFIAYLPQSMKMLATEDSSNALEDKEYKQLLFASSEELRSNFEYLASLRAYVRGASDDFPIGKVSADKTLELYEKYYNRAVRHSYGEEKYIYQLALTLGRTGAALDGKSSRSDLRSWESSSEMTLDDVAFLSGFLSWYVAHMADEDLEDRMAYALGWGALSESFSISGSPEDLKMKYFVYEDEPISEYGLCLGLID